MSVPVFEGLPFPQTGTGDWVRANSGTLQKVTVTVGSVSQVFDPSVAASTSTAPDNLTSNTAATRQSTTIADSNTSTYRFRKARASTTIVVDTDTVGQLDFQAYDGAAYQRAAFVRVYVDGAPSAGSMPGRYVIATTPTGTAASVERWQVRQDGDLEPLVDVAYDIGTPALAAKTVYANAHYFRPLLVSALPAAAAGNVGWVMQVTDATAPVKGAAVVGGGAVIQLVVSSGSAWTVL